MPLAEDANGGMKGVDEEEDGKEEEEEDEAAEEEEPLIAEDDAVEGANVGTAGTSALLRLCDARSLAASLSFSLPIPFLSRIPALHTPCRLALFSLLYHVAIVIPAALLLTHYHCWQL